MAIADLDNDGRLDLLIVADGEPLAYFHIQGPTGHFLGSASPVLARRRSARGP
jgi:enediyne biosynthesis protein E4